MNTSLMPWKQLLLGCLFLHGPALAFPAQPGPAASPHVLAAIEFTQGPESYQGTPYWWLGRVDIRLGIQVKPAAGHVLELLWGAKNDTREATITVNRRTWRIERGGYDGFRWLQVPIPDGLPGETYEVRLRQGGGKPGFIAAARLKGSESVVEPLGMVVATSAAEAGPGGVEAFPDKRTFWDREPEFYPTPRSDPEEEAAFRLAEKHGRLANEQFYRCRRFVEGWLNQADPVTGLIPRNLGQSRDIWNAQDAAADNYPFMVLTAYLTDQDLFKGRMHEMLRTETKLTSRLDRLPDTWSFSQQGFQSEQPNLDAIIFGGSEYVKDGLLPLTEWLGASPWSERMLGIVDDLWKHAPVETSFGKIPSTNVEVNGEMLQSLSRIYWMTGDKKYLQWAQRLGDYYLLGGHHPTRDFDDLRLRDHGCEIVSGLSELYVAVHFADPAKKEAYREPIHAMFDRILEVGRTEVGMLYNTIHPQTGGHDQGICDTWGYNYNGVYSVYLMDGTEAYREAVRHVLSKLQEHLTTYHWGSADEYADSIEGAINLYNREPVPSAAGWIDSEIRDMWAVQKPDGIVEGWHGDGNSARTAIMYATWKTQGLTLQPWREDVRLGAVRRGDRLYVSLRAEEDYRGQLVFDKPRHKDQMRLPVDYPRINQFPEWYVAQAKGSYEVEDVTGDKAKAVRRSGRALQEGIPVRVEGGREARWVVQPTR